MTELTMGTSGLETKRLSDARRIMARQIAVALELNAGERVAVLLARAFENFVEAKFEELNRRAATAGTITIETKDRS